MITLTPMNSARQTLRAVPWTDLGIALLAMGAFASCAYLSIELTRGSGRVAVIWLPNALLVAILLRFRLRNEPLALAGSFLGNVIANLLVGDSPATAAALATANSVEIVIAVYLVRYWCGRHPRMDDTHDLMRFFLGAGLAAPVASAMVAGTSLSLLGPFGLDATLRWLLSDALSMVVVAPSTMVFIDAARRLRRPKRRELVIWALLFSFGTPLTLLVFMQTTYPLLFLVPLVVLAHAFYSGTLGTAFSVIKVAIIAMIFTHLGTGPIHLLPVLPDIQLLVLEAFLASAVVVGMPVAAVLATRERAAREVALLAENVTDAILQYDLNGTCTYASPSTRSVLGVSPEIFVGQSLRKQGHTESREDIALAFHKLLSGSSKEERLTYRRQLDDSKGEPVYIEAVCAIATDPYSGEREGIVVSARDVTERVLLESKLKRAMRHAENAARAKSQFLANMSHEIRTPMNGVLGFAELLRQMPLDADAKHYAELIASSGHSMMMLLNDILDISKIESGQLVIAYDKFEIEKLVEDCISLHCEAAKRKKVRLTLQVGADVPRMMISDPLRLRQILLNLIANSVKFTETGSIEVSVFRDEDQLAVSVDDSGIGIDPARLEHIFDPFVQEESTTTRRYGGTGLGLSISRQLAELLGGTLKVASIPGTGSRFTLRIPLEEVPSESRHTSEPQQSQLGTPMPSGGRILLAEDHDVNRMLVTAMLGQLGQHVDIAEDGLRAVEKALAAAEQDRPYDLMLMDVQMPGCDGYSATRMIREAGLTPQSLPIIALTANAFPEDVVAAREAGMQAHLAKPLKFEDLARTLAQWLPVRIVDEAKQSGQRTGAIKSAHSRDMLDRWNQRRSEAIMAVSEALRDNAFEGVQVETLARTVHKLAGTAGMFGEDELGSKAAALERALRAGVEFEVRKRLAEELLAVA